ncbi:MAG: DNA repair protein RecN, partial [Actinomycetales bacterium]
GAGKTMVLTGLSLLMGSKADAGAVRSGLEAAWVDGEWLLPMADHRELIDRLLDAGASVDVEGGKAQILMARNLAAEGRSRAFAGGRGVPATLLAEIAGELIAVHGQSDQVRLRQSDRQRAILDRFAGEPALEAVARFRSAFHSWRDAHREVVHLRANREAREREAARLSAGIEEILAVSPEPGEDVELERQAHVLSHAGSLKADVLQAHDALVGGEDSEQGPVDAMQGMARALRALERVSAVDPATGSIRARLQEIASMTAELASDLAAYAADVDADPRRQAWVEERRRDLAGLRRKYGSSIDEVLTWLHQAEHSVGAIAGDDDRITELDTAMPALEGELEQAALRLSEVRTAAAQRLSEAVTSELVGLAMPTARFCVEVHKRADRDEYTGNGADDIAFLLEPHPGSGPRPLGKGASGGELSRVMLAIEVALAGADPVPTFVFDEVDAGVGGRAAVEVGRRLSRLGRSAQVLVVTHLPQVAAFADHHVVVTKDAGGVVTSSSVRAVQGEERVTELVRMLSGLDASEAGVAHARELLAVAEQERALP